MVGIGLKKADGLPDELLEKESANVIRRSRKTVDRIHIDKLEAIVNNRLSQINALENFDYAAETASLKVHHASEIAELKANNAADKALLDKVKAVK